MSTEDKRKNVSNRLMKARAIALRTQGRTYLQIGEELNVNRNTVTTWMASREVKDILAAAQQRLKNLVEASVDVYAESLANSKKDMTNAQKAATAVLKNYGLLKEQVDMNHNFPKPMVILPPPGSSEPILVLGTTEDIKKEGIE